MNALVTTTPVHGHHPFSSRRFVADKKKKRVVREWALRLGMMFAAMVIAQLGVSLYILPALGSPPFFLFSQGFANVLGFSLGQTHLLLVSVIVALLLLTTRGYVLPGTFICSVCAGPFTDMYMGLLRSHIGADSAMVIRVASVATGCVITAVGLALLIKARAGLPGNDLIAIVLSDKLSRVRFMWVRIGCDALFCATGFLLGGVLGFGSLLSVLLIGPMAQLFFPLMERFVATVLK